MNKIILILIIVAPMYTQNIIKNEVVNTYGATITQEKKVNSLFYVQMISVRTYEFKGDVYNRFNKPDSAILYYKKCIEETENINVYSLTCVHFKDCILARYNCNDKHNKLKCLYGKDIK
jgi:hypothetical protein